MVNNRVLVPRAKTETTVTVAITRLSQILSECKRNRPTVVVDVGTGSGVIIITIANKFEAEFLDLYATDISLDALEIAKLNAQKYRLPDKIHFIHGDLVSCLPDGVNPDLIIANLPYTPKGAKSLSELRDPPEAVFDTGDGTEITSRLFRQIGQYAVMPTALVIETAPEYISQLIAIANKTFRIPPTQLNVHPDHNRQPRVLEIVW